MLFGGTDKYRLPSLLSRDLKKLPPPLKKEILPSILSFFSCRGSRFIKVSNFSLMSAIVTKQVTETSTGGVSEGQKESVLDRLEQTNIHYFGTVQP